MFMHPIPRDSPTISSVLGHKSHDINPAPPSPPWRPPPRFVGDWDWRLAAGEATGATGRLGLDGLMRTEWPSVRDRSSGRLEEGNGDGDGGGGVWVPLAA